MAPNININRISQASVLSIDGKNQCLGRRSRGKLLTLFRRPYGSDQSTDLTRWRVVVELCRYFEDNYRTASCDLDIKYEKKRGVNNNYKLSRVPQREELPFMGKSLGGARLWLIISSSILDNLHLRKIP